MALEIKSRVEDGFAILDLAGQLTLGPGLPSLRDGARKILSGNKPAGLILRVCDITQLDSAGLGELTVVYTLATKRGCPLRLVEVSPALRKMLEVTRLDGLLPSAANVSQAKAEMRPH